MRNFVFFFLTRAPEIIQASGPTKLESALVCVCIYVCVCVYVYTHTHTGTETYIHTYTHIHAYCCMPTVTNTAMIRDLEVLSEHFNVRKFILTLLHKNKVKQQQQQICGPGDLCKQKAGSGVVMSSGRSMFISHQVTLKACKERSVLLFMLFM